MKAIKFDEKKVKNCIDAYKDEYGKPPYLVMNEKTKQLLPMEVSSYMSIGSNVFTAVDTRPGSISIDNKKYVSEETKKEYSKWYGCKVMIDNDLEYGEIHIG